MPPRLRTPALPLSLLRALAAMLLCALAAGCATPAPQLTRVVTAPPGTPGAYREAPAKAVPPGLTVMRGGRPVPPALPVALAPGDEIASGADTTAVIRFPEGHEVFVLPDSRIRIGSVFAFFGELFVRAKGLFSVETEFVTAGVEGTEFWLRLEKDQDGAIGVTEGRVRLTSKTGRWAPVVVRENDVFTMHRDAGPQLDRERNAHEVVRRLKLPPPAPPRPSWGY